MLSFHLWPFYPNSDFHPARDFKHVCICLPFSVTLKAQISAFRLWRAVTEKKTIKRWQTVKETANPSTAQPRSQGSLLPALRSERGRVGENPGNEVELGENDHRSPNNRAQGLLQPRDHRDTRRKRKNSAYMPNFDDKPNETIKRTWQSRYPGLLRPFLWISILDIARFIAQFNHDFPLSNCMEHGVVRLRP